MVQIQGSGAGNYSNTAIVTNNGELLVNTTGSIPEYGIGYSNFDIIRKAAGSPFVWYVFGGISKAIGIENLGSSPIYFNFNGSANPANSGTGFLDQLNSLFFDLAIGSISIQSSGITSPNVQVTALR